MTGRLRQKTVLLSIGFFLLILVAGCTGGSPSSPTPAASTPTSEPTSTATPSPTASPSPAPTSTPTSTPTLDDVSFPDGVTADSVTTDLLTSHKEILLGKTYTIQRRYNRKDEHNTAIRKTEIKLGPNKVIQTQQASGTNSIDLWKNGSVGYKHDNQGQFYATTSPTFDLEHQADHRRLRAHIKAGSYKPVGVVREDGKLLIKATASDLKLTKYFQDWSYKSIDSYKGELLITQEGRIYSLTFEMESTQLGPTTEEYEYRTKNIGETELSPPDWVSTAKKKAFDFEVSAAGGDDPKYIAVNINGDGKLPDRVFMGLQTPDWIQTRTRLQLEDGDTLYLAKGTDGELVHSVNSPPSGVQNLDGRIHPVVRIGGIAVVETSVNL